MKLNNSTPRTLLRALMNPITGPQEELLLDHFFIVDKLHPLNTPERRKLEATAIAKTCKEYLSFLEGLEDLWERNRKSAPANVSAKELFSAIAQTQLLDKALMVGYMMGAALENRDNEFLDPLAATFRTHRQMEEHRDPKKFEAARKYREEQVDKMQRMAKEIGGEDFYRKHYGGEQ